MTETSRSNAINELHETVTSSAIVITAKLFNHDSESKESAKLFRDLVLRRIQNKDYRGADSGLIYFYTKFVKLDPVFRYKIGSTISYLQLGIRALIWA